jgi:hypothetical protein
MKTYGDLNLKKIRESCDLDFAHYTYRAGQCSCCYGPLDMAKKYWRKGKKPVEVKEGGLIHYELDGQRYNTSKTTYILFKNACNGSGRIKSKDEVIKNYTCIEYNFESDEQKQKVCSMLQDQLGSDYVVQVPQNNLTCIIIFTKDHIDEENSRRKMMIEKISESTTKYSIDELNEMGTSEIEHIHWGILNNDVEDGE